VPVLPHAEGPAKPVKFQQAIGRGHTATALLSILRLNDLFSMERLSVRKFEIAAIRIIVWVRLARLLPVLGPNSPKLRLCFRRG
jgi:hypothetical protein